MRLDVGMTPFFNPGPIAHPKVPIYIAGVNRYMCRIAGEVCDGLHVHPFYQPYQPGLDDPRLPRLVKEFNG